MLVDKKFIGRIKTAKGEMSLPILLPKVKYQSELSIEQTLLRRRSARYYKNCPLELMEISQLLWAAQGITGDEGQRTAPSAGALYPLEIYLITGTVNGLKPGIYHYIPTDHSLQQIAEGDKRNILSAVALMQASIRHCAAIVVFAAQFNRTTKKYFEKGRNYVYMEVGHAAQNVLLQAIPLGIGAVTVGAFMGDITKKILHLPHTEDPLYLLPLGKI